MSTENTHAGRVPCLIWVLDSMRCVADTGKQRTPPNPDSNTLKRLLKPAKPGAIKLIYTPFPSYQVALSQLAFSVGV